MYLKFVRHIQPCGELRRGTLYSVHFQPNEMGGYNEHLTVISDAYEIPRNEAFPLPFIYQAQVVRLNGYLRLAFGTPNQAAALHLIDIQARTTFLSTLHQNLKLHLDIRIEIINN